MGETRIEIRLVEWRLNTGRTACWSVLSDWSNFPHDYFYGNCGVKVPIILRGPGI